LPYADSSTASADPASAAAHPVFSHR
jgi:hypothetical protein